MNVFRQELRMLRSSMVIWILVLCGLGILYLSVYPAFAHDAEAVRKIFSNIPAGVRAGLSLDVDELLSFLGFFAFTFLNVTLAAAIHAMLTGLGMLSREPRSKTTDFLLTKPRTRTSIFFQKSLAGLLAVLVVWMVFAVVSFLYAKIIGVGDFSGSRFVGILLGLLGVQLWFYACGLFVSQIVRHMKTTVPVGLSVVFGFFLVGVVGAILNEPKTRYFSPFKFFDYVGMAAGKGYETVYICIAVITIVLASVAAYFIYTRRDVKAGT